MIEKVELIVKEARRIADKITNFGGEIRVVSHFDADGICSAAIMIKALSRACKKFYVSFVKKLNDKELEYLSQSKQSFIIFTDLGSGKLDEIQELLKEKTIIIIDHHQVQGQILSENKKRVFHINPTNFGIDDNISGSGVSYIVARAMSLLNKDLSELAIVGALGDSQTGSIGEDWGLSGLNREILKDAEDMKKIRVEKGLRLWGRYTRPVHKALQYSMDPYIPNISGSESASIQFLHDIGIPPKTGEKWRTLADLTEEESQRLAGGIIKERITQGEDNPEWVFGDVYELLDKKEEFRDANEFATILNACGKMNKEYLGVAICFNNDDVFDEVRKILSRYRREIGKSMNIFEKNKNLIEEKEFASYVVLGDEISEDIISNVISIVSRSGLVNENKPIFAFVNADDGEVKISARMSEIKNANYGLNEVISQAASSVGGEGGGHRFAAGATIPKGSEEMFINSIEEILKNLNRQKEDIKSDKDNIHDTESQNYEALNNKHTDVKSKVSISGTKTDDKKEEGRSSSSSEKMERKGLVRYFKPQNVQ